MEYGFRVCFCLMAKGSLTSLKRTVAANSPGCGQMLKLSAGKPGQPLGKSERFSISGEGFATEPEAEIAGHAVRTALLLISARMRRGLDIGQNSLRSFAISTHVKEAVAAQLGTSLVEDHLGLTTFSLPKPSFLRLNMAGLLSRSAESFLADVAATAGQHRCASKKAESAAELYAISHFVGRAPARFLLLFVAMESLFEAAPRTTEARKHVDCLITATRVATIDPEEKEALCAALTFLKDRSIAQTGRTLADSLLGSERYESLAPGKFFSHVYKVRNRLVHRGEIDPASLHTLLGEFDRFVADLVSRHFVPITAPLGAGGSGLPTA
jgi:hypothetical protein